MINPTKRALRSGSSLVMHAGQRPILPRTFVGIFGAIALAGACLPAGAQAIFTDSFESGDMSHTQGGIKWASNANTLVYSGFGHSGTHCLKFAYPVGAAGNGSWAEQRFDLGANYPELYIEWYAFYPNGTEGLGPKFTHQAASPDNNKFLRLWSGNQSDGNNGYSDFYVKTGASTAIDGAGGEQIFAEYGENNAAVGPYGTTGTQPNYTYLGFITDSYLGRWLRMQVHVKVATSANNNGVIEIWRDGVALFSGTNLPTYPTGGTGNYYNFGYILGWANSGFTQATNVYIDDVSFSTTGFGSGSGGGGTTTTVPEPPTSVSVQ